MQRDDFATGLYLELRDSLLSTFDLLDTERVSSVAALADILTEVIVSVLIVLVFVAAYALLHRGLRFLLRRFVTSITLERSLKLALRYVLTVLALIAVLYQFGVEAPVLSGLARAAVIAFILYTAYVLAVWLLDRALEGHSFDRSLIRLFRNVLTTVIVTLGVITVLAQFGVNVISVVTTLGVVGIAVGLAAQSTLANLIAGLTILLQRLYRVGDWVEINGRVGKVREISLRTTCLVTRDNQLIYIPNESIVAAEITNFTAGGPLRVQVSVGIAYKESIKAAREVLMPVLEAHPDVLAAPPPQVRAAELGDSSVNLLLFYWIAPELIDAQPRVSFELVELVKEALDAAGIEIPFPHLQLFVDGAAGLRPLLEARGGVWGE